MIKQEDALETIHRRKGVAPRELIKKASLSYLLIRLLDDLLGHVETHEALFGEAENTSLMRKSGVSGVFSNLRTSSLYFIANRICALFDPAFGPSNQKSGVKKSNPSQTPRPQNLSIEFLIHSTKGKVDEESIENLCKVRDKFKKLNARNIRNKLASHLDMETYRNSSLITGDPFDYQTLVSLIDECKLAIELVGHQAGEICLEEKVFSNHRDEIRASAETLFGKLRL